MPFSNDGTPNKNRIHRITFMVGSTKTAAHVAQGTGSLARYDAARSDSVEPGNIQGVTRKDLLGQKPQTEED